MLEKIKRSDVLVCYILLLLVHVLASVLLHCTIFTKCTPKWPQASHNTCSIQKTEVTGFSHCVLFTQLCENSKLYWCRRTNNKRLMGLLYILHYCYYGYLYSQLPLLQPSTLPLPSLISALKLFIQRVFRVIPETLPNSIPNKKANISLFLKCYSFLVGFLTHSFIHPTSVILQVLWPRGL
jgi:hypothetical protein